LGTCSPTTKRTPPVLRLTVLLPNGEPNETRRSDKISQEPSGRSLITSTRQDSFALGRFLLAWILLRTHATFPGQPLRPRTELRTSSRTDTVLLRRNKSPLISLCRFKSCAERYLAWNHFQSGPSLLFCFTCLKSPPRDTRHTTLAAVEYQPWT